jgi:hypothetical protein
LKQRLQSILQQLRRPWSLTVVIGLWAAWLAWRLTSPRWLTVINWDQGVYVSKSCAPVDRWSYYPWNAHFAIGHVYEMGSWLARLFGGTVVDGYRLATAAAFAAAAMVIADASRRLAKDAWLGALCAVAWATSWVNLLFLFTLEDNVLYLPAAAAVFWLAVARCGRWGRRECVAAGALAAWAALQSWQALYYLGPAGYAALLFTRGGVRQKAAAAATVVAGFLGVLVGWCAFIALTSKLGFGQLLHAMFSRPMGSFSLSQPSATLWGRITGLGAAWTFTHTFVVTPAVGVAFETLGWLVIAAFAAVLALCTRAALRRGRWDLHLLALSLFLFTLVTPLYHDLTEWRYLVRFDFWPLLLALLLAALFGAAGRWRPLLAISLTMVIVWNAARAAEFSDGGRHQHPSLATWTALPHPNDSFYGRDGMSWFAFFRGIHQVAPNACRYVFALGEASEGWWNPDLSGSLFSELHAPVLLIGEPKSMGASRYQQPPIVTPADALKQNLAGESCAWVSRDASRMLGWRY